MFARKISMIGALLVASATLATGAAAQSKADYRHDIMSLMALNTASIAKGRADGDLTWLEHRQLRAEQARIAEMLQEALADRKIEEHEFWRIRLAQADAGRHIVDALHNGRVAYWRLFAASKSDN